MNKVFTIRTARNLVSLLILLLPALNLLAQSPVLTHFNIPLAAKENLNGKEDGPWYTTVENKESGQFLPEAEKEYMAILKGQVVSNFPRKKGNDYGISRTLADPTVANNFAANNMSGSVPLDNYLANSDSGYITSVSNTLIQVYNETGTILKSRSLQSFSTSLALGGSNNGKFDPKVMYDPQADRYIAVILNGFTPTYSKIILAFSQTDRPDSTWNFYTLSGNPFNDSTWFDYPAINITENEVFITGNQLVQGQSWLLGFNQSVIWQINKWDGYNGDSLSTNLWSNINSGGKPIRNLHPVKGGSDLYGPGQYFLSNRNISSLNDTIFLLQVTDTIGAPGAQLNVDIIQADKPYGFPPNGLQMLAGQYLATNDGRVLGGFYEDGKIYFASNSIDTSNGRAGIFFGEISGVDISSYNITSWMISNDTLDFGYPNLSWSNDNPNGSDVFLSFLHTGSNRPAGMSTIFYSDNDFSNLVTVKEGIGNLLALADSVERWGDYSGSQPKYYTYGVAWVNGTYGNTGNSYRTWIAELHSPFGNQIGIEENNSNVPTNNYEVYPNPVIDITTVELELQTDAHTVIQLFDLSGKMVGTLYNGELYEGINSIRFNIGHLAPGTYIVQVVSDGKTILNQKIIKQQF